MNGSDYFKYRFRFEYLDDAYKTGTFFCLDHNLKLSTPPFPDLLWSKMCMLHMIDRGSEIEGWGRKLTDRIYWVYLTPQEVRVIEKQTEELDEETCEVGKTKSNRLHKKKTRGYRIPSH
jgi:hypothetical protein